MRGRFLEFIISVIVLVWGLTRPNRSNAAAAAAVSGQSAAASASAQKVTTKAETSSLANVSGSPVTRAKLPPLPTHTHIGNFDTHKLFDAKFAARFCHTGD